MFGEKDFIAASRAYVCVRPDTFESETNQKMVRDLLGGSLQNTAFCLFAPDGKTRLSRSGRGFSPEIGGARGLTRIASKYPQTGKTEDALVPDFNSFRLALNVASADSRLLILVHAPEAQMESTEKATRTVAWDPKVVGRFHFDLETDVTSFKKSLSLKSEPAPGYYIVEPGEFGVSGVVRAQLALDTPGEKLIQEMQVANAEYAAFAERKVYQTHVKNAMVKGIYFEMPMKYGEDWDGDGEVDARSASRYARSKSRAKEIHTVEKP